LISDGDLILLTLKGHCIYIFSFYAIIKPEKDISLIYDGTKIVLRTF
jgi:hypothetical protein